MNILSLFLSCFLMVYCKKMNVTRGYVYPQLFREYVYRNLSESGKKIFFAVDIHPLCVEKKGDCIPRARCVEKKMLYLSRTCYRRDLVCCYDDTIRFPVVGPDVEISSPKSNSTSNSTSNSYEE